MALCHIERKYLFCPCWGNGGISDPYQGVEEPSKAACFCDSQKPFSASSSLFQRLSFPRVLLHSKFSKCHMIQSPVLLNGTVCGSALQSGWGFSLSLRNWNTREQGAWTGGGAFLWGELSRAESVVEFLPSTESPDLLNGFSVCFLSQQPPANLISYFKPICDVLKKIHLILICSA